ncbi:hypothetical protein ACERIM_05340 [Natrinema sp. H-ect1]|uniref:hypothetical protein n=1 Tax=Natrinema sp. H-ect1 TaxID=3242700 RepID=UPI00155F2B7C
MEGKYSDIELEFKPPAAECLEKARMPSTSLRIHPGGIEGGEDRVWHDASLPNEVFSDCLRCVAAVLENKECTAEFDMGELEFTPVPENDAVGVYFHIDGVPREIRDDSPQLVDRAALVEATYSCIRDWYEEAYSINPNVETTDWFQEIENAVDGATTTLQEYGFQVHEIE